MLLLGRPWQRQAKMGNSGIWLWKHMTQWIAWLWEISLGSKKGVDSGPFTRQYFGKNCHSPESATSWTWTFKIKGILSETTHFPPFTLEDDWYVTGCCRFTKKNPQCISCFFSCFCPCLFFFKSAAIELQSQVNFLGPELQGLRVLLGCFAFSAGSLILLEISPSWKFEDVP